MSPCHRHADCKWVPCCYSSFVRGGGDRADSFCILERIRMVPPLEDGFKCFCSFNDKEFKSDNFVFGYGNLII